MNCVDIELTNSQVSRGKQQKPKAMSDSRLKKLSTKNLKLKAPGEDKYGNDMYEDSAPNPKELKDNRNGVIPKSSLNI
jgi:hypothetical protein